MKIVKSSDAQIIKNSDISKLLEYSIGLNDKDVDFCINTISGRYPEKGYCTNENCKKFVIYYMEMELLIKKMKVSILKKVM